jgi:MFS transporter, PAT family, beta-lactamase induction signal transducer AmpG
MTSGIPSIAAAKPQDGKETSRNPWTWIPTLYLAEGLPYVVVMTVSVIMYKGMGISNTDIALYTSWLYLAWVIKPLWSPVVDILKTRRLWIWVMQLLIGAGLAGVALTIPTSHFFQYTLAFLWLLAFSSATHDIAADGYYMLATTEKEQAFFVGIRSTFYRISMISGQGLLVILAGIIQSNTGLPKVEFQVRSAPGAPIVQTSQADKPANDSAQAQLRVLASAALVEINPDSGKRKDIDGLIAAAKDENSRNGFYESGQKPSESNSWWSRYIWAPVKQFFTSIGRGIAAPFRAIGTVLEPFLRAHLAPKAIGQSELTGNVGIAHVQLSRPPGKNIVITLAQSSGGFFGFFKTASKNISVAEGARLQFNDENWNRPAIVVFQLDSKLKGEASAFYEIRSGNISISWAFTFFVLVALFVFFGIYHKFVLPRPLNDRPGTSDSVVAFLKEFFGTFGAFFRKERIGMLLLFLLCYRFAEAQLVKLVTPFLLDGREVGGLGLTTGQVGFVYGTIGIIALTCGGLLGGMVASRHGLKFWLWPMVLIMHLPDAVFVYLAYAQPDNFALISLCVAIEQFGYGFGFTAYMLYMIYMARGQHETAHYAICTGFMALGMMLPGMFSGWLQDIIGYQHFFVWVMLATIPGFLVVFFVPLDAEFGRKGKPA